MYIGISLDPRLEVFSQMLFVTFPLLEEKKSKPEDMPVLSPQLKLYYKTRLLFQNKLFIFMHVIANHVFLFCYFVVI